MSEIHFKYPIFFKEELIMSTIKKMLLVVTACVFVLALAACGPDKNNTTTTTPTPTTVIQLIGQRKAMGVLRITR